jgi:ABC-2 type transport system permease protein
MSSPLKTLSAYYKAKTKETFVYRGMILLWMTSWLISFLVMLFLWQSADISGSMAGFTKNQLITYYFIGILVWAVCGWYPFSFIIGLIKEGTLVQYITKPMSFYWSLLGGELAWHTVSTALYLIFISLIYIFVRQYLFFDLTLVRFILFILSMAVASLVTFEFNIALSNVAFWVINAWGFGSAYWAAMSLLGGHMIPLAFFPSSVKTVVYLLPFRFMYSFPLEIYLNQLSGLSLLWSFLVGLFWIIFLHLVYRYFWRKGIKIYTAFGQ